MKKIYQNEWFDIKFSDLGIELSKKEVASVEFYSAFYRKFYQIYSSYSDLPKNWLSIKNEVAIHINNNLGDKRNILSIGCGNGYIENKLIENNKSLNIIAIEPSIDSSHLLSNSNIKILNGYFPAILKGRYKASDFDYIYASSIDYVFDDTSYKEFLKSIFEFGIQDFLLTEVFLSEKGLINKIKDTLREIKIKLEINNEIQFWGYLRTIEEHISFLQIAGYTKFECGQYDHGAYWIRARI
tara:strand:- start:743 stop:1465 length:723 start_codon:yes stop_codon:yes gene_type:complete